MFYEDIQEQRPLAVGAHPDQPGLQRVVLRIGHVVLADRRVDGLDRRSSQSPANCGMTH